MKRLTFFLAAAMVVFLAVASPLQSQKGVPLPPDLKIIPPDPSLPQEIARLSGKWGDSWYNSAWPGRLDAILVFENIKDQNEAAVVYAIGDPPREWGFVAFRADWVRYPSPVYPHPAKIFQEQGKIKVSMPAPGGRGEMEFWLSRDRKGNEILEGRLYRGGGMNYNEIKMKRLQ